MLFAVRCGALSVLFCVLAQPVYPEPAAKNILPPFGHAHFCAQYPRDCNRTPGRNIADIPSSARWRELNIIHEWINGAIASKQADPGELDTWSLFPSEGNCNDYAVTKRHVLLEAGWPASSLLLAEVRLVASDEHHLILIVRGASGDWVLDNLRPTVVRLAEARSDYVWVRIESAKDPRLWTTSFAGFDPMPLASPAARPYAASSAANQERKRAVLDLRAMRRPVPREPFPAAVLSDLRG
jgi:predicted transglutaminase-like cysteine proteinase